MPINLQSDFKLYSLNEIISQISNLPEIKSDEASNIENYDDYNNKRAELHQIINKIEETQRKIKLVKTYRELIKTKIGERSNIQKNLQTSKNTELSNEINKLRVNMERYKTFNESQKQRFKELLHE